MQYDTNDLHARQHSGAVVAATTAVTESIRTGNADLPAFPDDLAAAGVTREGRLLRRMLAGSMLCVAVTGCGSGSGDAAPATSPSQVGESIPASRVTAGVMTQSNAQDLGMDWERLRAAAGSLPWQLVSAAGVQMAVACTGVGSPTLVYLKRVHP